MFGSSVVRDKHFHSVFYLQVGLMFMKICVQNVHLKTCVKEKISSFFFKGRILKKQIQLTTLFRHPTMFTPGLIWGPLVGILVGGAAAAAIGTSHGGVNGTGRIGKDISIVILLKFKLQFFTTFPLFHLLEF